MHSSYFCLCISVYISKFKVIACFLFTLKLFLPGFFFLVLVLTRFTPALILSPAFASRPPSSLLTHIFSLLLQPDGFLPGEGHSSSVKLSSQVWSESSYTQRPMCWAFPNHLSSFFVTAPLLHAVYLTQGSIIHANGFRTLRLAGSIVCSAHSGCLAPESTRGHSCPFVSSAPYSSCFLSICMLPFPH